MHKNEPLLKLTPCTKICSKWIIDLNIKCKVINFYLKNIGKNLPDLELSSEFLDLIPKVYSTKGVIDKLHFIRFKTFTL